MEIMRALILREMVGNQEMFVTPVMLGILVTAQPRVHPISSEIFQGHAMHSKHADI
jgi:hypothetical protein